MFLKEQDKNTITYYKSIVKHLPMWLKKAIPREVFVGAVSAALSRKINRRYRKKDRATNVLSFRYSKEYGEILVCPSVIRAEAKAQGNSFDYQMTWMIVHGMLHLSGMHHEESASAEKRFSRIEQEILEQFRNGPSRHHHRR